MSQFYPKQHPLVLAEADIRKKFTQNKETLVVVLLETKDQTSWLAEKNYSILKKLTEKFSEDGQIGKIISLSNLQGAQSTSEQIDVGLLFDEQSFPERRRIANHHPFVKPQLLNQKESMTLMVLQLNTSDIAALKPYADQLESYFKTVTPQLNAKVGGLQVLQSEMARILKDELIRSSVLGFFLFIIGLLFIYKKPWAMIPVLLCLIFVNTVILGLLAFFGVSLNVLSSTLPILVSLGVISLVIHIQGHFNKTKNIAITYKDLFWENLLAVFIAGLGFLFLRTSDSLMIKNYGTTVAMASFGSWFLTHLAYWPLSFLFSNTAFRPWLEKPAWWTLKSMKIKKSVIAASLTIAAVGVFSATKLNWNSLVLDDLPEHKSARVTTELIDAQFGGTVEMNFVLGLSKGVWLEADSLNKLNQLIQKIQKVSSVGSVSTVTDIFKSMSPRQNKRWVASANEINDTSFLLSMGASNPLDQFLTQDRKEVLIKVRYKDASSQVIQNSFDQISSLTSEIFPSAKITRGGFAEQFHVLNQLISKDLVYNFWHAVLFAGFLLTFVFKSWRLAIVACLPNLLPPLALLAWVSWQQLPLKPSVAIIFSIAIGMAFANTVYILGRIVKIRREKNLESYVPLKRALLEEGNPCLVATTLVLFGFIVFLFSQFGVNKLFGQYMILSVVFAFFGDLVFMPSLIQQFRKFIFPMKKKTFATVVSSEVKSTFLLFSLSVGSAIALYPVTTYAQNPSAADILKSAQASLVSKDDSAKVTMKILEANGDSKMRELTIKRKFAGGKNQTLVKILSPVDQKGAGLLSVVEKDSEQQWVYLPSSKQVRRFVSKNKQEGVLGSELSPQDLDFNTVKTAQAKLVKTEKIGNSTVSLIEVVSKSNETAYSKALLWINRDNNTPLRMDYFDAKGQPAKRVEFLNYVKVNKVQRAQKVVIKNFKNKRGTELVLSDLKVNSGLSDDQFTQRALSRD